MRYLAILLCLWMPLAGYAQDGEADRGYLAGLLEDALGGEGRTVRIVGFEGAFSSAASISEITLADREGVWLTLSDVVIEWNRAALLRGRIDVGSLSAEEIALPRLPLPAETQIPDPEATPFSLPDLPVSVQIGALDVARVALGAPLLGEPVTLEISGSAELADGSGAVVLEAERRDDKTGVLTLDAAYTAEDRGLRTALSLREGADGIAARLLNLPGAPDLELSVSGEGTLADFSADIGLATNGAERLSGAVTLLERAAVPEGAPADLGFAATLEGDVTALFLPEYRAFFGDNIALEVRGARAGDGALSLEDLSLQTEALSLDGEVALNADAWPTFLRLDGRIAHDDGRPVLLPAGAGDTRISEARLRLRYDAMEGDAFQGGMQLREIIRDDVQIEIATLGARGSLRGDLNSIGEVIAALRFSANGIAFSDPDVASAIGRDVTGSMDVTYTEALPVVLDALSIEGATWSFEGDAVINALSSGFETTFEADVVAQDLSAFAPLAGQPIGGAAQVSASGSAALGGFFDVELIGDGQDLRTGVAEADTLLRGLTSLEIDAARDETGVILRNARVDNDQISLSANGTASGDISQLSAEAQLAEINPLVPSLNGPVSVVATATGRQDQWQFEADGTGPYRSSIQLSGAAGQSGIDLRYTAQVPDVAPIVAELPGPVEIDGTARQEGSDWIIDTAFDGPAGTQSRASGRVASDGALDLALNGSVPLGLANPALRPNNLQGEARFDLVVRGAPALGSVSGTVVTENARFVAPALRVGLGDIDARVALSGGAADVLLNADVLEGGTVQVSGPVTLSGAFPADLQIVLDAMKVIDPSLYDTTIDGDLRIAGPLAGGAAISGQIDVGETMVQVPTSGLSTFGALPEIRPVGAPRPVMRTLERADLLPKPAAAQGGAAFPLDILVRAPGRIFVRGRGLDAELGGQLRLTGTTADILSTGQFELIRGRLDVLAKRFELSEGLVQLQGRFEPFLRFVATTQTDTGTASVVLEGPAAEPNVRFEAVPEAPEDQVLAQIFFGRDVGQLSAFQALQLANAVATLSGGGSAGVIGTLRQSFDLDDLDVTTDEDGNAAVRAGKYISENIYTDVTVGGTGGAAVSLNIDLTPNLTARGSVEADSNTSLGIFFERDY